MHCEHKNFLCNHIKWNCSTCAKYILESSQCLADMFFVPHFKFDKWHATKNDLQSQKRRHKHKKKTVSTKQNPVSIVISTRLKFLLINKCQISSSSNKYDMSTTKNKTCIHVIFLAPNVFGTAVIKTNVKSAKIHATNVKCQKYLQMLTSTWWQIMHVAMFYHMLTMF